MAKEIPKYNPNQIEPKWQKQWAADGVYEADLNSTKEKYVGFAMFNYPSGKGIHIGHGKNFTLPDVVTRTKRQQGFETYQPVGFDSFGLPAENYAIKTGTPPAKTIADAIANYRKQYKAFGWGMDWSKEIDSSDPSYYKWTQWCFLKLLEHGLAYQKVSSQWWCNACKTVLANEQVSNGMCWRHDGPDDEQVVKKSLKQWFFKITEYADELLDATDDLDWTDFVKVLQKNWIGRSEGAFVNFELTGLGSEGEELKVFTTAYDTIYGATFMVVSPEHPMVAKYASKATNSKEVADYVDQAAKKSELDREKDKSKTGIKVQGWTAKNPANGQYLEVWIADYVMMGYGTGAIMAVPGGDARDHAFATKYELPIVSIAEGHDFVDYGQDVKNNKESFAVANSGEFTGQKFSEANSKILNYLVESQKAEVTVQYKMRDWLLSRQRYWGAPIPIIHCPADGAVPVPEVDLPLVLPEVESYEPTGGETSVLAGVESWVNVDCPKCGGPAKRETDTMDGFVCSSWYFLRYLDPDNDQQAWDTAQVNKWLPIDFYNGGDHATAHLLYSRFFQRFFHKIGLVDKPEPFKKMYYHAKIMAPDGTAFSKSKGNGVDPLEIINSGYGADALRTYICFIAPPDMESPWSDDGVPGAYRFLNRVWTLAQEFILTEGSGVDAKLGASLQSLAHKTTHKVTSDIEAIKLNTAVAAMMEMVNDLYKLKIDGGLSRSRGDWQYAIETLLQLLAPFAPHIADELWHQLGHKDTINVDHWPIYDPAKVLAGGVKVAVQINGKLKDVLEVTPDMTDDQIKALALEASKVKAALGSEQPKKIIYVPNRIVNLVVV